jgi:ABC-type uncharacterized transport system permease subunit
MLEISISFYALTVLGIIRQKNKFNLNFTNAFLLSIALSFHALSLTNMIYLANPPQINFSFFNSLSMSLWWISIFFSFLMIKNPLNIIGVFLFTLVTVFLSLSLIFPDTQTKLMDFDLAIHIFLSITAYSFLFLTFIQSFFLSLQDNFLHKKSNLTTIYSLNLPPLETMEKLLFQLLTIGFITLTFSLITGFFFLEDLFAQHLIHKTVLSLLSWLLFLIIIIGHKKLGWRNNMVNKSIQIGFVLLLLSYYGSKFVLEKLL